MNSASTCLYGFSRPDRTQYHCIQQSCESGGQIWRFLQTTNCRYYRRPKGLMPKVWLLCVSKSRYMIVLGRYIRGTLSLSVHCPERFGVGSDGITGLLSTLSTIISFVLLSPLVDAGRPKLARYFCLLSHILLCHSTVSCSFSCLVQSHWTLRQFFTLLSILPQPMFNSSLRALNDLDTPHRNYGPNVQTSRYSAVTNRNMCL